jgi:hypothetical protein
MICWLTHVQREAWRICCDAPEALSGFNVSLRFLYDAGFSSNSGCRVYLEQADSLEAVKKRVNEKSSETLAADVAKQETQRLNELIRQLGFFNKVRNQSCKKLIANQGREIPRGWIVRRGRRVGANGKTRARGIGGKDL